MLDGRRLRRILEMGRTVVSELDLEALLERILHEARALTGARYAALGILDEQRSQLERFLTSGVEPEQHAAIGDLPRGRGVLGVLIDDPRPLRLDDVSDHPRSYGFPLDHPRMRSFLGVPIAVRGEAFGNLYLTEKRDGEPFDADDEEAVGLLASWASIAIDNARAYQREHARRAELEQAVRALEATTAIARAVGGETDLERVLELIAKRARALVAARGLLILLSDGSVLRVAAIAGTIAEDLIAVEVPFEGSVSGHVMTSGKVERLANVRDRLRFTLAERLDVVTGLFVPLTFRGRAVGVLAAFDRDGGEEFTNEDERLLKSFAASAATAVATAQSVAGEGLRRSIEASERERQRWARELHDETLQELAALKVLLAGARRARDPAVVQRTLETAIEQIDTEITGLRRLISDLRPAALDVFGVKSAVEGLAERVAGTSGLEIGLEISLAHEAGHAELRLASALENALYRLVQEALTNVVKHADAQTVTVAIRELDTVVDVVISDDGTGFDAEGQSTGFGLVGMHERVLLANGTLTVTSTLGEGTTIHACLPVERAEPARRLSQAS